MKIAGLQKVTLIDYPEKIACTIFLYGCNFRCGFCHNPELVVANPEIEYTKNEILEFLEKRKKYLEGICITGGEPLMSIEKPFLEKIKKLGYKIKIDTNGSFPEKLKEFINEELIDFVSLDVKTSKEKYKEITNSNINTELIEKSIKLLNKSNLDYEFRTTILQDYHTKEEIKKMLDWIYQITEKKPKKFVLQGFKNQGKFIDSSFNTKNSTPESYLRELKSTAEGYFEKVEIRD